MAQENSQESLHGAKRLNLWKTDGKQMFGYHCAPRNGLSGKGNGSTPKTPRADLTLLAQNYGSKPPRGRVTYEHCPGISSASHGTSDMPVCGPPFQSLYPSATEIIDPRIKNQSSKIESLQVKE